MNINKIMLGAIACFALATNAAAANKTHVTDTQGAGNRRVDIGVSGFFYEASSSYTTGGVSFTTTGTASITVWNVGYTLGVTDRADVSIIVPVSETFKSDSEAAGGGNRYVITDKSEGMGDVSLGVKYLLLDKKEDSVSWLISAVISPSTAPSDPSTPEVTTNGTVTTVGITGKTGRGYTSKTLGTMISLPTTSGDVYLGASYFIYPGPNVTTISFGIEIMPIDGETFTPFFNFTNYPSSSTASISSSSYRSYQGGILLTKDVTKSLSINAGVAYSTYSKIVDTGLINGTLNMTGYSYQLSANLFF